jgi:hypothetical protein
MVLGADRLDVVFELDSLTGSEAARRCFDALGLRFSQVKLHDVVMSAEAALEKLAKERRISFNIETDSISIRLATVAAYRNQALIIEKRAEGSIPSWEHVLHPFLECAGFTQACSLDQEYTYWQSAADPLLYRAAGRSFEGLPMKSNGLPYPLEQSVIDTSRNPGRRVINVGYVEMVGYVMWFGQAFWDRVGHHRLERLRDSGRYRLDELSCGIVRVVVSQEPFVNESNRDVQDDVRSILFG